MYNTPVVMRFKRENLNYSIGNYAYVESHVMSDDAECSKHLAADILAEGNRDRVTRVLGIAHAGVLEMLYPYTKKSMASEDVDDNMWEPKEYRIEMMVPETFSQTTVHLLKGLIHDYMVYRVLEDWMMFVKNETAAEQWRVRAAEAADKITEAKNSRIGGALERRLSVF